MSQSEDFLFTIVETIQKKEAKVGFSALSDKEQAFYSIWDLEAELLAKFMKSN